MLLHAQKLQFNYPKDYPIVISAGLSTDFKDALEILSQGNVLKTLAVV
jgi:hypothetical protein